jgi:hypothetical protein
MTAKISIPKFIHAIQQLPPDKPVDDPGVWYKTQKEHWLGWLKGYNGPGAYGRKVGKKRDARYAYNHIVNYKMLLWIIDAACVRPELVKAAKRASAIETTLPAKSSAIRRLVPWDVLAGALFDNK